MISIIKKTIDGLYNIALGLLTVLKQAGRRPITSSYPDVIPELYPMSRHRLALTVNPDTSEHLCIACKQCERICPDTCITVIPDPEKKGGGKDRCPDRLRYVATVSLASAAGCNFGRVSERGGAASPQPFECHAQGR